MDDQVPELHRVVGLTLGDVPIAYPFKALFQEPVLYQTLGGQEIVLLFDEDTTSPVAELRFRDSRSVGSVGVFLPLVNDQRLTFKKEEKYFVDQETGSTWNVAGKAIAGKLEGKSLVPVFHTKPFWFYWASANPDTEVYKPEVFDLSKYDF